MAGATTKKKEVRLLSDILEEFRGKVIKTAQKLQQELAGSAEKPALDGSTTAADEDPPLLALSKSATEKEQQKQRHRINGQLQNPKRQSDRANALRALPLAVLRDLLPKEKMGA